MNANKLTFEKIESQFIQFAKNEIHPAKETLITSSVFPRDIWEALGKEGLLGITLTPQSGGAGLSFSEIARIAECLNAYGGVPGLTMSLVTHWMFTKLHLEHNLPDNLKSSMIPQILDGRATICVAISEPGIGAHPKHLKSSIRKDGNQLILNGEKTFLTNGPIASHYLVVAISGERDGRKEFSAVLVPADVPGLQKTEGMKLDFLHPCPHGGIIMTDVTVPSENLLGQEGNAFRQFSLSTRHVEDAIGAAAMQGSLTALLKDIAANIPEEENSVIGAVAARIEGASPLARLLADCAETPNSDLGDLYLGYRTIAADIFTALQDLMDRNPEATTHYNKTLLRDIGKIQGIAKSAQVAKLTKKGAMFRET